MKKRIIFLLAVFLTAFLPFSGSVKAKELDRVITGVTIWDVNNGRPLEKDSNGDYQLTLQNYYNYRYAVDFDLSAYDGNLKDGDRITLTIPSPVTVKDETFDVIDKETGRAFGEANITSNGEGKGGSAVITLKNIESYLKDKGADQVHGVKGNFYVSFKVEKAFEKTEIKFPDEQTVTPLTFTVLSKVPGKTDYTEGISKENFSKFGGILQKNPWQSESLNQSGEYRHNWYVRVNTKQAAYDTIEISDYVGKDYAPTQMIPETLKVEAGWFGSDYNLKDRSVLSQGEDYTVTYNESYTSFTLTIKNAKSHQKNGKPAAFIISYSSTAPADGTRIQNNVEMSADGYGLTNADGSTRHVLSPVAYSTVTSGGSITLQTGYRITLYKVDSATQKRLAGAQFKIAPPAGASASEETVTTNENGVAQSKVYSEEDIKKGLFTVTEVKAPDGYEKITEPFTIQIGKEGAIRTVENKKASTTFTPLVQKKLSGRALKEQEFEFVLKDEGGKEISRVKNLKSGEIRFPELTFTSPGTYHYKITEAAGDDSHLTYDQKEIDLVITVSPSEDGHLKAEGAYSQNGTFQNRYTPDKTKISVKKVWDDQEDRDGLRPDKITVKLLSDGKETGKTLTLSKENQWTGSFENLDRDDGENQIAYSVKEETPDGYESTITGDEDKGFTITNRHEPETVSLTVNKIWDDQNDQDGLRPESVTVHLLADGRMTAEKEIRADENGEWNAEFTNLPKYQNGREIRYTIHEKEVPSYESEVSGTVLTNRHVPKTVDFTVRKVWDDRNNQDGLRPDTTVITLLADGQPCGKTLTLSEKDKTYSNIWESTFKDLPQFKDGHEITYSIREENVPDGYTAFTSGNTITNTHIPERVTLSGRKTWEDDENRAGKRPDTVSVALLADGKDTGLYINTTEKDGWSYTFRDLDKMKDGKAIHYSVREVIVPAGYQSDSDGMNLKNRFTGQTPVPPKPSAPAPKATASLKDHGVSPNTGIRENVISATAVLLVLSGTLLILSVYQRKK